MRLRVGPVRPGAAEPQRRRAAVRGGRFCLRTALELPPPPHGAVLHCVGVRATMLDADGLPIGADVEGCFGVEVRG